MWQRLHCVAELHVFVAVDAAHPAVDAVHCSSVQEAGACGALFDVG
jgi:hypothetical protein